MLPAAVQAEILRLAYAERWSVTRIAHHVGVNWKSVRKVVTRRSVALARARPAPTFLVSDRGRPLEISTVRRTFYVLSRQASLRGPSDHHGPRLHDFRRRFGVETLVRWYRAGHDVERRLPTLATYLGHAHVTDTYWYLSACPALLGLAKGRMERRWEAWP